MNLTLRGANLRQTPTDLTLKLLKLPSREEIFEGYLEFMRACMGLTGFQTDGTLDQVRGWFNEKPNADKGVFWSDNMDFLGYRLCSLLTGKFFYMLRDYFEHEKECREALDKGGAFSLS